MEHFFKIFNLSFKNFLDYLPVLTGGIVCIILTFIIANLIAKGVSKFVLRPSKIIEETVGSFPSVLKTKEKSVKVIVDSLNGDKAKLLVIFWFDNNHFKGSKSGTRTEIMFAVFRKLEEKKYVFSG